MINSKKKILFLTNIPSPYRVNFFNELGKYCDLTVLFERKDSEERDSKWNNKKINNFTGIFLKGIKRNPDGAFCPQVVKYLKRELYDVIIVGGYSTPTGMLAIDYLRLKKIPFILNTDGGFIKEDNFFKKRIKKRYISSADFWLSTGSETTKYLEHYGANSKKIFDYPFTSLFKRDILKKPNNDYDKKLLKVKLSISEDKAIVTVGQFIHRKGFDILLKAAKNISENTGIYIIGGKATPEYVELKDKLKLKNVHFVEFLTKKELNDYYEASDLFVLPTREDIWGLVVNEAMAYGLPIITTDKCIAGLELVEDYQNGFIVPSDNPNSLALKINEILDDSSLRKKMAENNLEKVKNYTIENMAESHYNFFKEEYVSIRNC